MAAVAVRSSLDDDLTGVDGHLVGEKLSQDPHGVEAKSDSREHQDDAHKKDRHAMPDDGRLRKEKSKGKCGSQRQAKDTENTLVRASVAVLGAIFGGLVFGAVNFEGHPRYVDAPKDDGEEGSAGKR